MLQLCKIVTRLSQGCGNCARWSQTCRVVKTLRDGYEVVIEIEKLLSTSKSQSYLKGYKNKTQPLYKLSMKHQAILIKSTKGFYLCDGSLIKCFNSRNDKLQYPNMISTNFWKLSFITTLHSRRLYCNAL